MAVLTVGKGVRILRLRNYADSEDSCWYEILFSGFRRNAE